MINSEYLIKENFNILKYESEELEDTGSDWDPNCIIIMSIFLVTCNK